MKQVKELKLFLESIKHLDEEVVGAVLEATNVIFESDLRGLIMGGADTLPAPVLEKKLKEIGKTMEEYKAELAKLGDELKNSSAYTKDISK